jgi:predicted TIM-barrel fold metal-dependent hydrolase
MVIDFHVHLTTVKGMERQFRENGKDALSRIHEKRFIALAEERWGKTSKEKWAEGMKKFGVDRVVLNATDALNDELLDFVQSDPQRFSGFYYGNPMLRETVEEINRFIGPEKLAGIGELSPTWEHYSITDERMYPFYERVQELQVPILWHFGIGFFPFGDLRFSKAAELESILRLFPKIPHTIAHLGMEQAEQFLGLASWLKDWLQVPVYFDLGWLKDVPKYFLRKISLKELIGRFVKILGPEQILWATDSGAPYETNPFESETFKSLESLKLGASQMDLILGENATKLLRLSES